MDHLNITFEVARGTFWLWNLNIFYVLGHKGGQNFSLASEYLEAFNVRWE
jgi:hypothetical protein